MFKPQPLSVEEEAVVAYILSDDSKINAIFNLLMSFKREDIEKYCLKEFKALFYPKGSGSQENSPRRYWGRPGILGWDMFEAIAISKANHLEAYENYCDF